MSSADSRRTSPLSTSQPEQAPPPSISQPEQAPPPSTSQPEQAPPPSTSQPQSALLFPAPSKAATRGIKRKEKDDKVSSQNSGSSYSSSNKSSEASKSLGSDTTHSSVSSTPAVRSSGSTVKLESSREDGEEEQETAPTIWGLLAHQHPRTSESIRLDKNKLVFGRLTSPDVIKLKCEDRSMISNAISNRHFEIIKKPLPIGVVLRNLSTNGTYINGEAVAKNCDQFLRHGDEISLVKRNFVFYVYTNHSDRTVQAAFPFEITSKYNVTAELGRGACGVVHQVCSVAQDSKDYALKTISKTSTKTGARAVREAEITGRLFHPNLVKVHEVIDTPERMFLVLQLVLGGVLSDRISNCGGSLEESTAKVLFYQIASGVQYLHSHNIVHRDLKLENILLSNSGSLRCLAKVTDMGCAKHLSVQTETFCGTLSYLAPETFEKGGVGVGMPVDLWALGVLLFTCLSGEYPFPAKTEQELYARVVYGELLFHPKKWSSISETAADLVRGLLVKDPSERLTISQCLDHPWLKDDAMLEEVAELIRPEQEWLDTLTSCLPSQPSGEPGPSTTTDSPPKKKLKLE